MKDFLKKGLVALTLMLSMAFAFPQQANASKNPFGPKGWICAANEDFNITLFEDGTIWVVIYEDDGSKTVSVYDPESGTWYSNRWTSAY